MNNIYAPAEVCKQYKKDKIKNNDNSYRMINKIDNYY